MAARAATPCTVSREQPLRAPAAPAAGMAGNDGGQTAQFVSNASFATLALIYTVTELLDLSDRVRFCIVCVFFSTYIFFRLWAALCGAATSCPAALQRL